MSDEMPSDPDTRKLSAAELLEAAARAAGWTEGRLLVTLDLRDGVLRRVTIETPQPPVAHVGRRELNELGRATADGSRRMTDCQAR
jgi:hypothetical protein